MLFGGASAWNGQRRKPQQPAQPAAPQQQLAPQAPQQAPQAFQPPQVQWPQPTPDMAYANNLAQFYASQMPNQQVPGSTPMPAPTMGPTGSPYAPPQTNPAFQPAPLTGSGTDHGGGWRDMFRQARDGWQAQRPDGRNLLANWHSMRPRRQSFF